jgi:hypothetical protein
MITIIHRTASFFLTSGNRQLVGYKNSFTYTGSFNFFGLEPATQYEVIIQSRNREGWSDPSEIFKFSTRPHGKYALHLGRAG